MKFVTGVVLQGCDFLADRDDIRTDDLQSGLGVGHSHSLMLA